MRPDSPVDWRGVALAMAVAMSFAANSVFAGVSYRGGADAVSVFVARSSAAFVLLFVFMRVTRRRIALPARQRNIALALGAVMAWASYALLAAMESMPVALCVITLYTYPVIVAIVGWLSGREAFTLRGAVAVAVAFTGLVLALDLTGQAPSTLGVALAASAALGVATLLLVNERAREPEASLAFSVHMLGVCMTLSIMTAVVLGRFALPQTGVAWLGFVATPLTYSFAIVFMFVALSMIGSLRTALVMNLEPVSSVILGYVLLAQALAPGQLVGVLLVVGAIVAIEGAPRPAVRAG